MKNPCTKIALGLLSSVLFLGVPAALSPAAAEVSFGFSVGGPTPPPPPRVVTPISCQTGFVYREGHYGWRDRAYIWVDGECMPTPYSAAVWVPGHWVSRGGVNVWIEGHWE